MAYTDFYSKRVTPQNRAIPGETMIKNKAGGFVYEADDFTRLLRFLILGVEGNTYYVNQAELTVENAEVVVRLANSAGKKTVDMIVEVSKAGRAIKNDPALFALAICAASPTNFTRRYALSKLPEVARTASHLIQFVSYVTHLRGWGRGLRESVANWYLSKPADDLAYQVLKYRNRYGWTHRDLLRLAHPKPTSPETDALFHWITRGEAGESVPNLVQEFRVLQGADEKVATEMLVANRSLSWEMLPNDLLNSGMVWRALLPTMPMTAMIRNLPKMSSLDMFKPLSIYADHVVNTLGDSQALAKARVHPVKLLAARLGYGQGSNRNLSWQPNPSIVSALEKAFYAAFKYVEPANKAIMLGVDVSGSMSVGAVGGVVGFTPAKAAAAMALVLLNTEPRCYAFGFSREFKDLKLRPDMSLEEAFKRVHDANFGGTDCALPMRYALRNNIDNVDAFIILSDYETWAGGIHPIQALEEYNKRFNRQAKLVTVAFVPNNNMFYAKNRAVGKQQHPLFLDVVGFDTSTPEAISAFLKL